VAMNETQEHNNTTRLGAKFETRSSYGRKPTRIQPIDGYQRCMSIKRNRAGPGRFQMMESGATRLFLAGARMCKLTDSPSQQGERRRGKSSVTSRQSSRIRRHLRETKPLVLARICWWSTALQRAFASALNYSAPLL